MLPFPPLGQLLYYSKLSLILGGHFEHPTEKLCEPRGATVLSSPSFFQIIHTVPFLKCSQGSWVQTSCSLSLETAGPSPADFSPACRNCAATLDLLCGCGMLLSTSPLLGNTPVFPTMICNVSARRIAVFSWRVLSPIGKEIQMTALGGDLVSFAPRKLLSRSSCLVLTLCHSKPGSNCSLTSFLKEPNSTPMKTGGDQTFSSSPATVT